MRKMSLALVAVLGISATYAFAGPKSFRDGKSGVMGGREYDTKVVTCSGRSETVDIFMFKDTRKWCLKDESYCSKKPVAAAAKACKRK
jgi:hypothetical protein